MTTVGTVTSRPLLLLPEVWLVDEYENLPDVNEV